MAYSWVTTLNPGEYISNEQAQENLDNIKDIETTRLKFAPCTHTMDPSTRALSAVCPAHVEPNVYPFTGDIDPTFPEKFVEESDVQQFRGAIDQAYDYRSVCRIHYGSDYQGYLTAVRDVHNDTVNPAVHTGYCTTNKINNENPEYNNVDLSENDVTACSTNYGEDWGGEYGGNCGSNLWDKDGNLSGHLGDYSPDDGGYDGHLGHDGHDAYLAGYPSSDLGGFV